MIASRYEILELLGKGGMGVVYRAKDRVLDDIVALKLLSAENAPPEMATRFPEMARRFRSEIRLARRVTHRNVCRIHEYGEDGELRYIAMEFVDGADLKHELRRRGPLPPEEAFAAAIGVGEALEAIHEEGIVHRDLKTPNIMRDRRGVVKVMDFGIAKPLDMDAAGGLTGTGMIVGTPDYLSPEQARALPLDPRSDIYSLGIVIFELFTGQLPFKGATPMDTILMHIQQPPPLEAPAASRLPSTVVPVLRRALAKNPDDRYADARDMVAAIRAARELWHQRPLTQSTEIVAGAVVPVVEPLTAATPVPTVVPTSNATAVPTFVPTPSALPTSAPPMATAPPRQATLTPAEVRSARRLPVAGAASPPRIRLLTAALTIGAVLAFLAFVGQWERHESPLRGGPPSASPLETPEAREPTGMPAPSATADMARVTRAPGAYTPKQPPFLTPVVRETPRGSLRTTPAPAAPLSAAAPEPSLVTVATPRPTPSPGAPPPPGVLQLIVHPWAEVTVNGKNVGTTPLKPLVLGPGDYVLLFTNPSYRSERRTVTITTGETVRVEVELKR